MISGKLLTIAVTVTLVAVAGCKASGNRRAPVEERNQSGRNVDEREAARGNTQGSNRKADGRSHIYTVQKGDTLYSIAFENGLDYREVAEQNNIENPSAIQIGQQIRLIPADDNAGENRPRGEIRPVAVPSPQLIKKDTPKVIKLPYSEQAVVQIEQMQNESVSTGVAVTPVRPPAVVAAPVIKPVQEDETVSDEGIEWIFPTKGKVIGEFSESANRKGLDISGSKGQAVVASAAGKVVYSGSGLRGYGKLVIIKHNKTYLSAYAHNDQLLVKEGQAVNRGQKIAEMGSTDTDQVKLHFEIRKFGKPVDPSRFVNANKS